MAVALALAAAMLAAGCSDGARPPAEGDGVGSSAKPGAACAPSFGSIRKTIFVPSCATADCHSGPTPQAGLDLAAVSQADLVGAPASTCAGATLVVAGSAAGSFLYQKLLAAPPCGDRMPVGGALSAAQIGCIGKWIDGLPPGGSALCERCGGSACVDLETDARHCGACGDDCGEAACEGGECVCAEGLVQCGRACVDLTSDAESCGACRAPCPAGAVCVGGVCTCAEGMETCDGACVDLASDPLHCGACGAVCGRGTVCAEGACALDCGALANCSGACVDLSTSVTSCGACGVACAAGQVCEDGACACPQGSEPCGGACVDTTSDSGHCGACGQACSGGRTCQDGACACPPGSAICGGVCVAVEGDAQNCGACGNVCAVGQTCVAGACTCGQASVSYSETVQPIFDASCTGCHSPSGGASWMSLTAGQSYSKLVNVDAGECVPSGRKRVLPGAPSESYLVDKLMNVDHCGPSAMPMPPVGQLPDHQIQAIADWICMGAPDN